MLYLDIEREALAHEAAVAAHGTLAAIASAFGVKGALKSFVKAVRGKGARAGDAPGFAKLRGRIGKYLAQKEAPR